MQRLLNELLDKKSDISTLDFIEQIKYLAYFHTKIKGVSIFTPQNIITCFEWAQLPKPKNMKDMFNKSVEKGTFIPCKKGFVLNRDEIKRLEGEIYDKPKIQITKKLRDLLPRITNSNEKSFLEEAVSCFEVGAYRATILLVWILTLNHLFNYILNNKLGEFNKSLKKQNSKISKIIKKDDFSEIKEDKFIEICRSANIISNDVRKILDEKRGIRNSCAHPNSIVVKEAKAINFVEDLIENIVTKF